MAARFRQLVLLLAAVLAAGTACAETTATSTGAPPLVLERTIPLKNVAGRIDHLAIDLKRGRLFVAELGNGTVDAIDLARGQVLRRISGLKEPQGLAYLPDRDELVVTSGGDGSVRFYRGASLAPVGTLDLGQDADNVRVDPRSGRVVVGYGSGALAVIDPASRKVVGTLPLPGHPEGFQLNGARAFVNVPASERIVVGDLARGQTAAAWSVPHLKANFPMALDWSSGDVTVVFRSPARLVALDVRSGQVRRRIDTCRDADDIFINPDHHRLYVICGEGAIDILQPLPTGYGRLARLKTGAGARTALLVPEQDRLFVAAPSERAGRDAAIMIYRVQH